MRRSSDFRRRFVALTTEAPDPLQALAAVLYDCFDLTEQDVMRNRVLVSEQGLLGARGTSPREEEARQPARSRARELEFAWASLLAGAMRAGRCPGEPTRAC